MMTDTTKQSVLVLACLAAVIVGLAYHSREHSGAGGAGGAGGDLRSPFERFLSAQHDEHGKLDTPEGHDRLSRAMDKMLGEADSVRDMVKVRSLPALRDRAKPPRARTGSCASSSGSGMRR
jgi:hypothetical protein